MNQEKFEDIDTLRVEDFLRELNVIDPDGKSFYSTIFLDEQVKNLEPENAASKEYFPVMVLDPAGGFYYKALFTQKEIDRAVNRGAKNEEDFQNIQHRYYSIEEVFREVLMTLKDISFGKLIKIAFLKLVGRNLKPEIAEVINELKAKEGIGEKRSTTAGVQKSKAS